MSSVFDCQMCGQCCEGQGGIVVSPSDLERICLHLKLQAPEFIVQYALTQNGKIKVRCGEDGFCVFFKHGTGCIVHEAKPDICRAWPFFRGNMLDSESLFLAKEYCSGIRADCTHSEFVAEGLRYLQENSLQAKDAASEAHALLPLTKHNL